MTPENKEKFDEICRLVCESYKIEECELQSNRRFQKRNVLPRFLIWSLSKKTMPEISLYELGKEIANRNHSSVCVGIKKIENYIVTDKSFRVEYELLLSKAKFITSSSISKNRRIKKLLEMAMDFAKGNDELENAIVLATNLIPKEKEQTQN